MRTITCSHKMFLYEHKFFTYIRTHEQRLVKYMYLYMQVSNVSFILILVYIDITLQDEQISKNQVSVDEYLKFYCWKIFFNIFS